MLVVMNLHRLRVDERFERVVVVAERRQFEDASAGAAAGAWACRRWSEGEGARGQGDGFEGVAAGGHGVGMFIVDDEPGESE